MGIFVEAIPETRILIDFPMALSIESERSNPGFPLYCLVLCFLIFEKRS